MFSILINMNIWQKRKFCSEHFDQKKKFFIECIDMSTLNVHVKMYYFIQFASNAFDLRLQIAQGRRHQLWCEILFFLTYTLLETYKRQKTT